MSNVRLQKIKQNIAGWYSHKKLQGKGRLWWNLEKQIKGGVFLSRGHSGITTSKGGNYKMLDSSLSKLEHHRGIAGEKNK